MEELIIGGVAGVVILRVLLFIEHSNVAPWHRVYNRLRGHKPARPMRYSGAREAYFAMKEQERDG